MRTIRAGMPFAQDGFVRLLDLVALVVIGAGTLPLFYVLSRRAHGCTAERNAAASLKSITTAEADFRANDRDGNGVADFWTADVYNLYALCPLGALSRENALRLIEPSVAGADAVPDRTPRSLDPGSCIEFFSPKRGYWLGAWLGPSPEGETHQTSTAGDLGPRFHRTRFAFYAAPEASNGRGMEHVFVVNGDNTIWLAKLAKHFRTVRDPGTGYVTLYGAEPLDPTAPFPADPVRAGWSKMD